MASIIQPSDFTGENLIPDMNIVAENVQAFIDKYEPMLLEKLLGVGLYTALKDAPTDARFVALLPYLKLAIVDFVYWYYNKNQYTQSFGNGEGKSVKQNATNATPYMKMVRAWNEMVNMNIATYRFLYDNTTYPEYDPFIYTRFYCYEHGPNIYEKENTMGI